MFARAFSETEWLSHDTARRLARHPYRTVKVALREATEGGYVTLPRSPDRRPPVR
jgi:hypothetical protein